MHFLVELPEDLQPEVDKIQKLVLGLFTSAPCKQKALLVKASSDFLGESLTSDCFYMVKEGSVKLSIKGNLVAILDKDDLIGLNYQHLPGLSLHSDLAVQVDAYQRADFFQFLQKDQKFLDLWTKFLDEQISFYFSLYSRTLGEGLEMHTDVQSFSEGETIIEQGSPGTDVFHMLEGHADVVVDGVKVAEIQENEIFGALAGLTSSPRSASVVASKTCLVMKVKSEQFLMLVKTRPVTVLALLQNMAKSMVSLNERVVDMSKLKG